MAEGRLINVARRQQEAEASAWLGAADWLETIKRDRAIAVIRADSLELSLKMAQAVIAAGLRQIEITSTSVEFTRAIAQLRGNYPDCIIGSGTIVQAAVAKEALAAGAQFIFAPYYNADVMAVARDHDVAIVPGALTPTEIGTAWREGATAIKVFPIKSVGGVEYIKALAGPMGEIPLIPTGGVTCENSASYLQAGAIAIGLSTDLFPKNLIRQKKWMQLEQRILHWKQGLPLPKIKTIL